MKYITSISLILFFGCATENDQATLNRALDDETMQLINLSFEKENEDLYGEVDKRYASLMATRGELFDRKNFMKLDYLFGQCKLFIDSCEENFLSVNSICSFTPNSVFETSIIDNLQRGIDFDLHAVFVEIVTSIESAQSVLSSDTINPLFRNLNPSEYIDNADYKYADYSCEIDSLLHNFKSSYNDVGEKFSLIDVLEFFTFSRSTLLLAERKSMRFHNSIVLTRPQVLVGNKIDIVVETNKHTYSPSEKISLNPFLIILNSSSFTKLNYSIDSGEVITRPICSDPTIDTIFLNTTIPGNHSVSVKYFSADKNDNPFVQTYSYTVLEK